VLRFLMSLAITAFAVLSTDQCLIAATPADALKSFELAEGFEISLVASEPEIRQPVAMQFDDRGRLWVVQYLQYPDPAGLKKVKVDQYMRTRFDRVPEPPPRGPKGADRITICEDTDGDGRMDKFKDFASGLNMATGIALGYGGVFVAQSPYLLFYPDRNRDDVPDGDPQVLVTGFGMEDSHAYPNSLQIGPDGWLYGAQGSNVWAKVEVTVDEHGQTYAAGVGGQGSGVREDKEVDSGQATGDSSDARKDANNESSPTPDPRPLTPRALEFNQCIFRYHPPTGRFEIFAEGGGNTWGVDFDRHGQIIAGTNFGGVCGLHMVQGGYYVKGFAKHGPLSNPHAYGYFEHMPYGNPARISQGEHVMCGGIVYQGGAFGPEIENQYITCALLHRAIYWHKLTPDRSTFKSDFGGALVTTDDPEFRPVDLALAPDGSVYIADWTDVRANHVIPEDTWNKTNGRIYRLAKKGTPRTEKVDLAAKSSADLIELLEHKNAWHRREAVRLLGERNEIDIAHTTDGMIAENKNEDAALAALWVSNRLVPNDQIIDERVRGLLRHKNEHIRAWAVRLIGDRGLFDKFADEFISLAKRDASPRVRSQLASTLSRVRSSGERIELLQALAQREEDVDDPHIPLLLWWAIDRNEQADSGTSTLVLWIHPDKAFWKVPLVRQHLTQRFARRLAATGGRLELDVCGALWGNAPSDEDKLLILKGIDEGLATAKQVETPDGWDEILDILLSRESTSPLHVRIAMKFGNKRAYLEALRFAADANRPERERIEMLEAIAPSIRKDDAEALLKIVAEDPAEAIRLAALGVLSRIADDAIAARLLASVETTKPVLKSRVLSLLAARKSSAAILVEAVAAKQIQSQAITADLAHAIQQHSDPALTAALEKHVGKFSAQTSAEKQEQINRVAKLLAGKSGDATHGKALYTKHCGICHTLHGEGNKIGPDLTTADRGNRSYMLANIVDPNLGLRQEYAASTVRTVGGQILTGIVIERTAAGLTLVDAKNVQHRVATAEIDELKAAEQSLMPEKTLDPLSETETRDLFAYLEAGVRRADNARTLVATFDAGGEEWTITGNSTNTRPEHQATGGVNGGFIVASDSDGTDMQLVAPLAFRGDLSRFASGMIWFDAKTLRINPTGETGGKQHPVFGTLAISDGKTTIRQDLFHPTHHVPTTDWQRFSGRLTPEAFETDAATFQAVMSNASSIGITVEAFANAREVIGIDNVTFQAK
jgi:putative membrane-bound dehydrogenase-like protein